VKGIKKFDASMSKFYQSLGVGICCTLCICNVGYTSPSFVTNVVILEKSILNLKIWHYFKNIFHLLFKLQMRWKKLLWNYVDA
jgi:hypothetical protein